MLVHVGVGDDLAAIRHRVLQWLHVLTAVQVAIGTLAVIAMAGLSATTAVAGVVFTTTPLMISAYLIRTGRLERTHRLTSVQLVLLIATLAIHSGGATSFVALWLVLVPLVATLSGDIRTIAVAGALAIATLIGLEAAAQLAMLARPRFSSVELAGLSRAGNLAAAAMAGAVVTGILAIESTSRRLLVIARDEAERAKRVKSAFLATVSHELRTPLAAIIGFSDLLRKQQAAGSQQRSEHVRLIRENGEQLLDLVTNMIDATQIETGSFVVAPEPTPIGEVIAGVVSGTAPLAKRLRLAIDVDPVVPDVMVDPRAAKRILLNLLSNAIKFTPDNGLVTLSARGRGSLVEITVSDTGAGIAAEHLPYLGQPFYQVDAGYTRTNDGAGLGLAIVRGLAELHGGGLRIESRQGVGSRFIVSLPAALQAPIFGDRSLETQALLAHAGAGGGSRRSAARTVGR